MGEHIQLGDCVRFRAGVAPEALKDREKDLGAVLAIVPHGMPEPSPVVQLDNYRTAALSPGLPEVVGEAWPAQNFAAAATKV